MVREGGRSAMAFPTQAQALKDEMTQEEGAPPWPLSCSSKDNNTPRYKTVVCAFGPETYHDRSLCIACNIKSRKPLEGQAIC